MREGCVCITKLQGGVGLRGEPRAHDLRGGRALAGDQQGNIRVWDLTAGACSCELVPEVGTPVRSLTVAQDASMVIAANNAGEPCCWRFWERQCPCRVVGCVWGSGGGGCPCSLPRTPPWSSQPTMLVSLICNAGPWRCSWRGVSLGGEGDGGGDESYSAP